MRLLKQSALSGLSNANPRLRAPPAPCKEPRVAGRPLMMCFLACMEDVTGSGKDASYNGPPVFISHFRLAEAMSKLWGG